jgi:hypothetical protein
VVQRGELWGSSDPSHHKPNDKRSYTYRDAMLHRQHLCHPSRHETAEHRCDQREQFQQPYLRRTERLFSWWCASEQRDFECFQTYKRLTSVFRIVLRFAVLARRSLSSPRCHYSAQMIPILLTVFVRA